MSYIAFDLDALNVSRDVGAAAGISEERVTHGLLRMWAWCFREKADTVESIQVQGFFGCAAAPALVAFGFLEEQSGDSYRVRGAERYLRVSKARSEAGQQRAMGAGRVAGRFTSTAPATTSTAPANDQQTTSKRPALTPSTEHRTPVRRSAPAPQAPRESDAMLEDFVAVIGSPYAWQGAKDGVAFAELLKLTTLEEIRTRWRRGLQAPSDTWASCRTVAQLRSKWNDLASTKPLPFVSIEHQPSRIF